MQTCHQILEADCDSLIGACQKLHTAFLFVTDTAPRIIDLLDHKLQVQEQLLLQSELQSFK